MSNYRRHHVPGGRYFFTVVTRNRRPLFDTEPRVAILRNAFRKVKRRHPFRIEAIVVLPDHLHAIWQLPEGDSDFSARWREIKKAVTRELRGTAESIWQPRFWEHWLRDERDWRRHIDYIHYNPVKHGLASSPLDWPWSSFRQAVAKGWYEADWGKSEPEEIREMELE